MKKIIFLFVLLVSLVPVSLDAQPKVILLDLGGLFYKFSALSYARKLGLGNILYYVMRDFKNPKGLESVVFGALSAVPQEEIRAHSEEFKNSLLYKKMSESSQEVAVPLLTTTRTSSGRELPYIITAYQAGHLSPEAALELVFKTFDDLKGKGYFASDREADLTAHAIRLIFTPDSNAAMNNELADGIKLLKELAAEQDEKGDRKFVLVALSNVDKQSARILEERLRASVYGHFQYLFYSGDLGTIKPNDEAFILPFEELNKREEFRDNQIKLEDIIFLDDQPENVHAAKKVGIHQAILYKNGPQAREELVKLGVLAPKVAEPSDVTLTKVAVAGAVVVGAALLAYQYC